jgi:hypothetical protein
MSVSSLVASTSSTNGALLQVQNYDEKIDSQLYDKLNLREVLSKLYSAGSGRRMSVNVYTNDNRKAFLQGLNNLHKSQKLIDCLVSSSAPDGVLGAKTVIKDYPCHKLILAAHSPVLASLIEETNSFSQDGKLQITLEGIPGNILELMLNYMYSGEVSLSDESVVDVFTIANKFGIEDLQQLCEEHVGKHISVETVIPFMLDANLHKATKLNERCQTFLKDHMRELLENHAEQVMHLPKPVLIEILKVDLMRIDETEIFKLVKTWGETRQNLIKKKFPSAPVPPLKEVLSGLVECIRFVSLPKKFLQKQVLPLDIISEEMMIQILFHKAKDPVYLTYDAVAPTSANGEVSADGTITPEETPLYLRARGNQWKTMEDFQSEEAYATYMKSVLRPGMRIRAIRTYENVLEGDTGEFVQWNAGFPPCQVRWNGYGSTYWLHWRDIVICEN